MATYEITIRMNIDETLTTSNTLEIIQNKLNSAFVRKELVGLELIKEQSNGSSPTINEES